MEEPRIMLPEEWLASMQARAQIPAHVKRRHSADVPPGTVADRRRKSKAARKSRQINRRRSK